MIEKLKNIAEVVICNKVVLSGKGKETIVIKSVWTWIGLSTDPIIYLPVYIPERISHSGRNRYISWQGSRLLK